MKGIRLLGAVSLSVTQLYKIPSHTSSVADCEEVECRHLNRTDMERAFLLILFQKGKLFFIYIHDYSFLRSSLDCAPILLFVELKSIGISNTCFKKRVNTAVKMVFRCG